MPKIIHDPNCLLDLTRDELDEILIDEYKNPALLRELIRVCLYRLKEEQVIVKMYKDKKNKAMDKYENLREEINKVLDNYKH